MKSTVSVIIPAYNAMNFLPETLDSVLSQTFQDFEIIIVNDGSEDNIKEWGSEITDPRVSLISQENKGLPGARNTGITHSNGEYIAFLDADDIWEPTKLEKQVKTFELNPELGLVDTQVFMVDQQNNILYEAGTSYQEGNVLRRAIEENLIMCGSSPTVRRKCFEKVGLFDIDLRGAEDWHMWARIAIHYQFKIIQEPLVRYRQHPHSMSKNWQIMESATERAIEKLFQLLPSNLLWVKKRTHARANIYCAQMARAGGQYKQSLYYCLRAFSYSPQVCLTYDYFRLLIKIILSIFKNLKTKP